MRRKIINRTALILTFGLSMLIVAYWLGNHDSAPTSSQNSTVTETNQEAAPTVAKADPNESLTPPKSDPPLISQPTPQLLPEGAASLLHADELVNSLTRLDISSGSITREQADQWNQCVKALAARGPSGVSAIREFLDSNQEVSFAAVRGAEFLGEPSVRLALLDALKQSGAPEALETLLQTLRTTAVPSEVALIAQHLDALAPAQYRQETLNAVNEVLGMASQDELKGLDVGPLFQILQSYGDSSVVQTLEQLGSKWNYYAAITLAGLPDGEGIDALIRKVSADDASRSPGADFSFQMLSQMAAQYPDAGAALVDLAQKGKIPDSAWRQIASGLGGDQFGIGLSPAENKLALLGALGAKTYHMDSGNQSYYSIPISFVALPDQAELRRSLIDQLLAANPSQAAAQALQRARAQLSSAIARN
jgi:hypothetical protein